MEYHCWNSEAEVDEQYTKINALDGRDAAEEYAEWYYINTGETLGGDEVFVRPAEGGDVETYKIQVTMEATYYAHRVDLFI